MLHTPLHEWHQSNGARMAEFGGWDMPIQYSTITKEHQAIRNEVGLFDVSHMGRLSLSGDGALDFLESVCTNSIGGMKDFQVRYNLICNEQGGVLDDVLVYRWPYGWSMVVNASNREKIVTHLNGHKGSHKVEIEDRTVDTCMIAVQGPKAIAMCKDLVEADVEGMKYYYAAPTRCMDQQCMVSRTGYTGEDGLEFSIGKDYGLALWETLISRGAAPCGLGARDTLRLEAAMPLYGHELNEETDPLQVGLQWAVKLKKGDFIGRDAIAKRKEDELRRVRVGLEMVGKRVAREESIVLHEGKEVGTVTSGTFSPTLQKAIAMAMVDPSIQAVGTDVMVNVRGKEEAATIVEMPFYRREK